MDEPILASSCFSELEPCRYCQGVSITNPVRLSDLWAGFKKGCALCSVLSRGIAQLGASLSENEHQTFNQLDTVCFSREEAIDGVFNVRLKRRRSWSRSSAEELVLPLDIFADCKATFPPKVPSYPVPNDVPTRLQLSDVVTITRKWIASCDKFHPRCAIQTLPSLPSRVIDLGTTEKKSEIKLIVSNGECASYIALSYCWGPSQSTIKTNTTSLPLHLCGIPWDALPTTFQDVITICWALDIRYLWIDALCILQDNATDWELESAKMAQIYSNSYITIAATSCSDNNANLFSDRWSSFPIPDGGSFKAQTGAVSVQHGIQTFLLRPSLHLAHDRFIKMENARDHLADAPLLTRAWAYQERLLPARTLHFHAEELIWECRTSLRCECGGLDDTWLIRAEDEMYDNLSLLASANSDMWLKSLFASVDTPDVSLYKLSYIWLDLISEFSRLNLTYERDRLPALSGLAAKFSKSLGRYLAGIWEEGLAASLLYESLCDTDVHGRPPAYKPQAPSWSWASIPLEGSNAISYSRLFSMRFEQCPDFAFVGMSGEVLGKNPFGWVKDVVLSVQGKFTHCTTLKNSAGSWRLRRAGSNIDDSGSKETAMILDDGHTRIKDNSRLSCLYIGTGLGLVLQRQSCERHAYQRVGFMILPLNSQWIDKMEVMQIDIV